VTTKDEVIAAIEASDARVKALAPALLANGQAKLPESEWDVRQALCHVAARANAVPLSSTIAQRALAARAQGQPLDLRAGASRATDINQAQLDERQDRSVADLLAEIHAGHQAAIMAVGEMPPDQFDQTFPRFTGDGEMSLGDLLLRAGSGHETDHLNHIERALAAPAA
jgi:Mycothiol maleylpyruvate isomerase N-terminal domain